MAQTTTTIRIRGARENNLKDIDLDLPHGQLIAITGLSGSGKSSLAFDVLAREGQRRHLETFPSFARQYLGKLGRANVDHISGLAPVIALSQRNHLRNPRSTVGTLSDLYSHLRLLFSRFGDNPDGLSRSHFSFNSPQGACPTCKGLGQEEKIALDKLVTDPSKTLREGVLAPTLPTGYIMYSQVTLEVLDQVCQAHRFSVDIPWEELNSEQQNIILRGSTKIKVPFGKHSLESRLKWTGIAAKPREEGHYKGILTIMEDILRRDRNKNILRYVEAVTCSACDGTRIASAAQAVHLQGQSIAWLCDLELRELGQWLDAQQWPAPAKIVLAEMQDQIEVMLRLGLGYLQLSRPAPSLTQGEAQRIRLVNQLAGKLSRVLYILDEPSIGLHPRDSRALINILRTLVQRGNSVLVVEHEPAVVLAAEWIVDIGPAAGQAGGEVLFNGPMEDFLKGSVDSPTREALLKTSQPSPVYPPPKTPTGKGFISLQGCTHNNLKTIDAQFMRGALNVVSGVAGAGKASLVKGTLAVAALDQTNAPCQQVTGLPPKMQLVQINQKPIGRTPRSNPATYTGLADHIRDLMARQPEAKAQGFKKGRFSFNNKGGRCETCQGAGREQIGMHLLGQVEVTCGTCGGKRFNPETLSIRYQGLNIYEIFELRVREALEFFSDEAKILRPLQLLVDIGLDYVQIGQPSTTLSGGEAQRVKLAKELQQSSGAPHLYLLDEPSIGLHPANVATLLTTLSRLTERGDTVVCIEHDADFIQAADWLIDLGPGSGQAGGKLVYQGPPAQLLSASASLTGQYLHAKAPATTDLSTEQISEIAFSGVRTHLLKGFDVAFPLNALTVVTGVSGSGKSSLVFDTLFAEAQARFSENFGNHLRDLMSQANPAKFEKVTGLGPAIAVGRRYLGHSPRSTVGTVTGLQEHVRLLYSRIGQLEGHSFSAQDFSFNHESGACPACRGLGTVPALDPGKWFAHPEKSVLSGAIAENKIGRYFGNPDGQFMATLKVAAEAQGMDLSPAWEDLDPAARRLMLEGSGEQVWHVQWHFKNRTRSGVQELETTWPGFKHLIETEYALKRHNKDTSALEAVLHDLPCPTCDGTRLKTDRLSVQWRGLHIAELGMNTIAQMHQFILSLVPATGKQKAIESLLLPPILRLLEALEGLGLGYLSSNRTTSSLSGGEGQRLGLVRTLAAQLYGVTLVLDEPTIGLHAKDTQNLLHLLRKLVDQGNTVVVVEHDHEVIAAADHVLELGPGAGDQGGQLVFAGSVAALSQEPDSITGAWLADPATSMQALKSNAPTSKSASGYLNLKGCRHHNLNGFDLDLPVGQMTAVCGVSGSGKSTLVRDVLWASAKTGRPVHCDSIAGLDQFEGVHFMTQAPFARQVRSTVATWIGLMDVLRSHFAKQPEAKALGLKRSAFSYLHKDGACPQCKGLGETRIPMDFFGDLWSPCEACQGLRFRPEVLACRVEGHSIGEVLQWSVAAALAYFASLPKLKDILDLLQEVGLGHLRLGQASNTLSGGETQRLKLAKTLVQKGNGPRLFLLDEPSTGLHVEDVSRLVKLFRRLTDAGHTVVYIEHHPVLIALADRVVELGPGAGVEGGNLMPSE
ncbi:UNVERIFIED_CONTAM: hypothetical protein GTU68_033214 [Idotea baltica]|nr:hypothetical protein [Idotea baltica]